jgi:hypothetical protein
MDKRKGIIAGYKRLGPIGRVLFWCAIIGVIGVILTVIFFIVQHRQPPEKIDEVELADTTTLQEAIIMDLYKYTAEEIVFEHKGELFALLGKDTNKIMEFESAIADLIRRGIIRHVKLGQRIAEYEGLSNDAKVINNIMLTEKGKKLAKDVEYSRMHPELNLIRPIEK